MLARQAPLSTEFSRQEYCSGLPCPPPGDQTQVSCIAGGFFTYHYFCLSSNPNSIPYWICFLYDSVPSCRKRQMCFHLFSSWGFPGGTSGKESAGQCRRHKRCKFDPWVRKIPWRRAWQPTAVFLPGESHGQRSLAGYNAYGCTELDRTEVTQHACKHVLLLEKGGLHTLCAQFRMCLCLQSGRCFSCSASVPAIPFQCP